VAGLCVVALFSCLSAFAQSVVAPRVTQKIDESRLITLKGNVHPAANAANSRGPVADSAPVGHIILMLKRSDDQQRSLDALIDQLHNSQAENFHKWLTPEEFGRRFGPADEDVAAVAGWLRSHGFKIEDMPPSKTHITFTGTVGQMRQAFHVDIHHLSVNGEAHQAAMNEPRIPAALAPVVSGFRQLHDFWPKPMLRSSSASKIDIRTGKLAQSSEDSASAHAEFDTTSTTAPSGTAYEVGPQDFYTIYHETPLLSSGITGAGVTVAVIERTEITNSDITNFRSLFGLSAYPATPNSTQGGVNYIYGSASGVGGDAACTAPETGGPSADEGNADIGVEWAGVVAPNAIIDFVACGKQSDTIGSDGTDLAASHIANYLSSTVVAASLSYGECETNAGTTGQTFYNNLWEQYAAEGMTAVVSAGETGSDGDPGSLGCDAQNTVGTHNPSVNAKAATAYNLSAGGTDFGDVYISKNYSSEPASTWWNSTNGTGESSARSYVPEIAWGGECSSALYVSYLQAEGTTTYGTTYTPEAICNNTNATSLRTVAGGGGGVSIYNSIPPWQSVYGIGLYSSSATFRNQPDVALFAASGVWGHFLPYCQADNGNAGKCTSATTTAGAGGTSFVSPSVAGLMALVAQKSGDRQGQAAYTLYGLAAQEYGTISTPNTTNLATCSGSAKGANVGSSCIFYDIAADTPSLQGGVIASDTIQPCTFGDTTDADCYRSNNSHTYGLSSTGNDSPTLAYRSGAGYDLTTGLGSFNIANLVDAWSSSGVSFATTTTLQAVSGTTSLTSPASVAYSTTANLTFTATVTATGRGGAVPAGTVEFFDGGSTSGTLLGTGTITSSCTGTGASTKCVGVATLALATATLTLGSSNNVIAYFEGDAANDAASTSSVFTINVTGAPQAITFAAPGNQTYGSTLTLSATASSGLAVSYLETNGTGAATLTNGVLTFTGVGTISVKASQSGNSFYAAATSVTQTITIVKATPAVSAWPTASAITYGQTLASSTLTGGTASVAGAFAWTTPTTAPGAGTQTESVTFTPTNTTDYNTVTSTITVVVNKATPTVSAWPTASAITYGQTLASSTLTGGTGSVPGTFSWTTPTTAPAAGTQTESVTFTPTDTTDYNTVTSTITVVVNKATPTVSAWPTASAITYGQTLASSTLTGGTGSVPGAFSWTTPTTAPAAGTQTESVTFTPTDTTDYNAVTSTITVVVNKATPTVSAWPTASSITYGQTLASSTLTGGTGSVPGTFTWTTPTTAPAAGTQTESVTFTPTDTTDYNTVTSTITVVVNKATPTVSAWPTASAITYGQTLASSTLTGGTGSVPGTFTWTTPTTVPGAGTQTESVTFTPTNTTDYNTVTSTITVVVNKATPTVSAWPTASAITYGQTLASSTLTGGMGSVPGAFTWTTPTTAPAAGTQTESVTFTPTNTTDYNTVTSTITVVVNQATPTVSAWPTASAITYGQALSASTLTGGTGSVPGAFSWTTPTTAPPTGTDTESVTFTPTNTTDYNTVTSTVSVVVNQATPTVTITSPNVGSYGAPLTLMATSTYSNNGVITPTGLTPKYALVSGPATVNPTTGVVTFTGTGTVMVSATVGGSGTSFALTTVQQSIAVSGAAQTLIVTGPTSATFGTTPQVTFTSTYSNNGVTMSTGVVPAFSVTGPATISPAGVLTFTGVGPVTVTITAGGAGTNFAATSASETFTVTQASQTIGFTGPTTAIYGSTLTLSATASSNLPVTYSLTSGPATLNSNVLTFTGIGTVAVTATAGGSGTNYQSMSATQNITVGPATLTVTVNSAAMIYGGAMPAFTGAVTGLVNGDTSNAKGIIHPAAVHRLDSSSNDITVTYSTTTPANSNVGTYSNTITAAVTGSAAGNYIVVVVPANLTISPAPLSIAEASVSGTYGQAPPAFSGAVTGLVNGDAVGTTLSVTYTSGASASMPFSDVGAYPISATVTGSSVGNYTVTDNGGLYTISPAQVTITVNSATTTYGTAPTLTSTFNPPLLNGDSSTDGKGIVHRVAVKRHGKAEAQEVGGVAGDLSVVYSGVNTSAPYNNVGQYSVTASLSGAAAADYQVTSVNAGTLTVTPAALSISENPATGAYGQAPPAFTGALSGMVNGDAVGTSLNVTYTTTASSSAPFSDVGAYPIHGSVTGSSATNYTVTDNGGVYTITPAQLTITVNNATDVYGNPLPSFSSTLTGLTNGDSSTDAKHIVHPLAIRQHAKAAEVGGQLGDLTVNYTTTASSTSPYSSVGNYPINATLSGQANGNYQVSTITAGTLTITPATLTITENPATGVYGSAPPAFSGNVSGTVNGDTVGTSLAVSYSSTASTSSPFSDVGAYPINASVTGSAAGNYTVADGGSAYLITPAPLTITVNDASEVWNSPLPAFTSVITGLVNGDSSTDARHIVNPLVIRRHSNAVQLGGQLNDLSITYTTTANSSAPYSSPGAYPINASLNSTGAAADYQVTVVPGTLTISQATQVVTFPYIATTFQYALTTIPLNATVNTGLPLHFVTQTPTVCTVNAPSSPGGAWTSSLLTSGYCILIATQGGTTDYSLAWSSQEFWIYRTGQTITFPYIAQTSLQYINTVIPLNATSTSGLPVTFVSQTPTICTVSESSGVWTASLLLKGYCSLGANQAGNNVYSVAPFVGQTFWVYGNSQTINFPFVAQYSFQYANTTVPLTATASSGLPVSFGTQTPLVCTVSESASGAWSVSLLTSGNCSLYATQTGSQYYEPPPFTGQTFWVYRATQTITFPTVANQIAGTSFLLPATASSGLAVSYTSTTPAVCTIDSTGAYAVLGSAGKCSIQANQPGNATFAAAPTVTKSFTVTVPGS